MIIIADSMSDIQSHQANAWNISVAPLYVIFGTESYLDDVTITRNEFYQRLERGELPKTSQVTPDHFDKLFRAALASGEEVVCITGSSKVSGTFQSATIARELQTAPEKVHLVDSLSGNVGEALLVGEACKLRDQGMEASEAAKILRALVKRIQLSAQVESLKHLALGGRISGGTAKVGALLHLKPLLSIENGAVAQQGMARGHKKVYQWFVERTLKTLPMDTRYPIFIASCNAPEALARLKTALLEAGIAVESIYEMGIGTVIGTHTGPGCLTLSWVSKA